MNEQASKSDAIILGLFIIIAIFLSFSGVYGQDAVPTPTPSENSKKELKKVDDKQEVQPENLKGVPAIAPNYESKERDLPDLGRVGVDMTSQKPLSLKEAIVKGLENNIDIEVTRKDVKIAEYDLKSADGFYEPRFSGQTFFERATTPNVSIFSTNRTTTNNSIGGNARLQGFLKNYGTTYFAELNKQRLTTNNPISILSPQNNTSLTFGIAQPLFRGRKFDNQRRIVEIAKKNLSLTDTQFRQKALDITASIQRAYWDLTFALKNLQVQRDGVRDAKDQLAHNRRLVKEGILAPIDVVAAETQVANLEQNVYGALEQVNRAENIVKNLIAGNRNDEIWSDALVPTDSVDLKIPRTTLKEALSLALDNRPELEINNVAGEINKLDQKLYREQDKPQIDLTASYSTSGLSGGFNNNFSTPFQPSACQPTIDMNGNEIPADPVACQAAVNQLNTQIRTNAEAFTGGPQSGLTDILANRYPTYKVGITFNLPLFGNRTTKANLGRSLVQADKIKIQREQIEQIIQLDVRNALQSLRTAEARLRSAAVSRENSEKQYESEKRKLDAGLSDIYKVLERQTALMNARSAEIQGQTEVNKAIAELQRATGNSLKANDLETRLRK
jgi:HAE1 family hydrophobic/amphiphilic exporter-1